MIKAILSTKELAERWGVHTHTIVNWRCRGYGPKYIEVGAKRVYDVEDVEAWEASQKRSHTSENEMKRGKKAVAHG